eukprot:1343736-Amphidinium_carterae.2
MRYVSQLSKHDFDRILKLWDNVYRVPALVFIGDFHQLPSMHNTSARDSSRWDDVYKVELHEVWRCQDPTLMEKLRLLRLDKPTEIQVKDICRGHKEWSDKDEPDDWDIVELFRKHPTTTVATCTRRGAPIINEMSIRTKLEHTKQKLLDTIPSDWEVNVKNFGKDGKVIEGLAPKPQPLSLYAGMRVQMTKNVNKKADFVNGMGGTVEG